MSDSHPLSGSAPDFSEAAPQTEDRFTPATDIGDEITNATGLADQYWTSGDWKKALEALIDQGLVTWKEVTALVLGHLNPSQVGTSIATKSGFQKNHEGEPLMRLTHAWHYAQQGICVEPGCGTRLELQADHADSKQSHRERGQTEAEADRLPNMTLRCRRHNVARRKSHKHGNTSYLTAEAGLMWILLFLRPKSVLDFGRMCRHYKMTMFSVRFDESWAMAVWLAKKDPPEYQIADEVNGSFDVLRWTDGAITRQESGLDLPEGATFAFEKVRGTDSVGVWVNQQDGQPMFVEQSVSFLPFSNYDLEVLEPQSLAIRYKVLPERKIELVPLPPRRMDIKGLYLRHKDQTFALRHEFANGSVKEKAIGKSAPIGRKLKLLISAKNWSITTIEGDATAGSSQLVEDQLDQI